MTTSVYPFWYSTGVFIMANGKNTQSIDSMIGSYLDNFGFATKDDVAHLIKKLDKLEKLFKGQKPDSVMSEKSIANRKTKSATDHVLEVISKKKDGAKFIDIQSETQFDDKKVRNIIYRLAKQGKIQRKKRGIYVLPR